jgi:hypothetical protein
MDVEDVDVAVAEVLVDKSIIETERFFRKKVPMRG